MSEALEYFTVICQRLNEKSLATMLFALGLDN
jgi:hypothetical protein